LQVTANQKEAWYTLMKATGELVLEEYPEIRAGISFEGWKRNSLQKWKKVYFRLTHQKFLMFRDSAVRGSKSFAAAISLTLRAVQG